MIARAAAVGLVAAAAINLTIEPPAGAMWGVLLALGGSRHGSSASTDLVAPTGAKATCTSLVSLTVHVAWNAVTHASTYRVWRSTSKTTGYSVVASGVTATSWTSSGLSAGHFLLRGLRDNRDALGRSQLRREQFDHDRPRLRTADTVTTG